MRKIYSIAIAVLLLTAGLSFGQSTQVSPVKFSTQVDAGVQCSGGQIHDDGVAENGYGWNATAGNPSGFCTKFIPTGYPYKFSKFCIALTRLSTGVANWTFKVVMWKSVNGMPGPIMDSTTVTASAVPIWPTVNFFDFNLPTTWANVTGTDSVFIGMLTNPVTMTGVFVASDESTTTPIWPGWATTAAGPWQSPTVLWTGYRAFLQRAEGSVVAPLTLNYPTLSCNYGTLPAYTTGVFGHASAVLVDTLYVTGSTAIGTGSTVVQRYNVNTNTYSLGTVLPEAKTGHSLTRVGNALYLIGGSAAVATGGTTCYKYTPATGWTSIAPLPAALSGHVSVNWGDSVIFVVGGPWAAPSTTVYFYRVADNTWGTSTACLAGRRSAAIGIVGNKIIIAAGYNAAFFKNTQIGTIGANATTITWAAGPDVPLPTGVTGSSRPGGTGVGTKFYFVPGEMTGGTSNTSDSIRVFDATTNTWESTLIYGRGVTGSASNYWAAVTNWIAPSGKVKILITGGALGTVLPGLCVAQVDPCTVTSIGGNETPANYQLSQNYPNPFNPVTKINYALPKSGLVSLKVYDILGKEVATLVSEVKNAGSYSVDFNGANLSSGVYFYKLSVGDFSSIKKMTLLK